LKKGRKKGKRREERRRGRRKGRKEGISHCRYSIENSVIRAGHGGTCQQFQYLGAEAGGSQVQDQPGLQSKTRFQEKKNKVNHKKISSSIAIDIF
jgi:hypothetical protein